MPPDQFAAFQGGEVYGAMAAMIENLALRGPVEEMSESQAHEAGAELMGENAGPRDSTREPVAMEVDGQVSASPSGALIPHIRDEEVFQAQDIIRKLRAEVKKEIVGQDKMVDAVIRSLVAREHLLIEGGVGVGKTQTVLALSRAIEAAFARIQMTPDLMPADILGHWEYVEVTDSSTGEKTGEKGFVFRPGPMGGLAVLILVDEGNRGQPRTKAALLEAMQHRTISTRDGRTVALHPNLVVFYTQNPDEMEGTYPLTEAEIDRFGQKIYVSPTEDIEEIKEIMRRNRSSHRPKAEAVATIEQIMEIGELAERVELSPEMEDYIAHLVRASRRPDLYGLDFKDVVKWPLSERTPTMIAKLASVLALERGKKAITPDEVQSVFLDVASHRLFLHEGRTTENAGFYLDQILRTIKPGIDSYPKWEPPLNEEPEKPATRRWEPLWVSAAFASAGSAISGAWIYWMRLWSRS
ncbi:MAG: MoxR family ATPase [Elusimicrobia bacterium]|nr:MoxR family ATPase [Elusimicrobiota bacterium]